MMAVGLVCQPSKALAYFHGKGLVLTLRYIVAMLVVIPLAVLVIIRYGNLAPVTALLLFLLAISPPAPLAPPLVRFNGGDLDWAISLMFLMTMISLVSIPWMLFLGRTILSETSAIRPVSGLEIFQGYMLPVFLPLFAGLGINHWWRGFGLQILPVVEQLGKWLNLPLTLLIVVINWNKFSELDMGATGVLLLFSLLACLLSILAIYPGASRPQYGTAIISAGVRNFGILFLLIQLMTDDSRVLVQIVVLSLFMILLFVFTGTLGSGRLR
jgi:bile acid:Na+ symporter, BASS family